MVLCVRPVASDSFSVQPCCQGSLKSNIPLEGTVTRRRVQRAVLVCSGQPAQGGDPGGLPGGGLLVGALTSECCHISRKTVCGRMGGASARTPRVPSVTDARPCKGVGGGPAPPVCAAACRAAQQEVHGMFSIRPWGRTSLGAEVDAERPTAPEPAIILPSNSVPSRPCAIAARAASRPAPERPPQRLLSIFSALARLAQNPHAVYWAVSYIYEVWFKLYDATFLWARCYVVVSSFISIIIIIILYINYDEYCLNWEPRFRLDNLQLYILLRKTAAGRVNKHHHQDSSALLLVLIQPLAR